jgi:hypothetical protein
LVYWPKSADYAPAQYQRGVVHRDGQGVDNNFVAKACLVFAALMFVYPVDAVQGLQQALNPNTTAHE